MTRLRLAWLLAVVAAVAVLASAAIVVAAYVGRDGAERVAVADPPPRPALVVRDPASGATFAVPDRDWAVKARRVRIYYADGAGDPVAVVRGPAVFREGYCRARPRGSNRAFAGFTREPFAVWVDALAAGDGVPGGWSTGVDRSRIELADGSPARTWHAGLFLGRSGACSAGAVEVAMVQSGGVRVVLVRDDTDERGSLPREAVEPILTSLRPGGAS
jgi:hypothetical protein